MSNKQVAKQATTSLDLARFKAGQGVNPDAGMEGATVEDFAIPFIGIIQALSPQRQKNKPEYIQGAEEGMIFNSVTLDLFEEGITVIPCYHIRNNIEWIVREANGGLVDVHPGSYVPPYGTARDEKKRDRVLDETGTMTSHQLVMTHSYYVLLLHESGQLERAVINMSSTQMKKAKRWNTLLQNLVVETADGPVKLPMQTHKFKLATVAESNEQGDWFGWTIENLGLVEDSEYEAAVKFYESVKEGEVKASYEGETAATSASAEVSEEDDEDLPF